MGNARTGPTSGTKLTLPNPIGMPIGEHPAVAANRNGLSGGKSERTYEDPAAFNSEWTQPEQAEMADAQCGPWTNP